MKIYKKQDFPVSDIRRFLEPGPGGAGEFSLEG